MFDKHYYYDSNINKQQKRYQSAIKVSLSWRGKDITLHLFHSDVIAAPSTIVVQDNEHNETIMEKVQDSCFYQTLDNSNIVSYAALSTCYGLVSEVKT